MKFSNAIPILAAVAALATVTQAGYVIREMMDEQLSKAYAQEQIQNAVDAKLRQLRDIGVLSDRIAEVMQTESRAAYESRLQRAVRALMDALAE